MGGSWSSMFSSMFSNTGNLETRQIIDTLLKRLIGQIDLRDMYSLADPRLCKQYIVVAQEAMEKIFVRIKISKEKDGTLFFQSMKGIQDSNPIPEEQTKRCNELAFFFIRMFQIYAAIALSIMDSNIPESEPTKMESQRNRTRKGSVFIKPDTGIPGIPQPKRVWWGRGGRLLEQTRFFLRPAESGATYANILNSVLVQPYDPNSNENLTFDGYYQNISIPQSFLYNENADDIRDRENAVRDAKHRRMITLVDALPAIAAVAAAPADAAVAATARSNRVTQIIQSLPVDVNTEDRLSFIREAAEARARREIPDPGAAPAAIAAAVAAEAARIAAATARVAADTQAETAAIQQRRQISRFKNLQQNPPDVFYTTSSKTLKVRLLLESQGGGVKITLSNIALNPGNITTDKHIERLVDNNGGSNGKLFNAIIKEMLDEAYSIVVPFSAMTFLTNKSLLSNGKIVGTNIQVVDKGGNKLKLKYTSKFKFDEREETVNISLDLKIDKQDKIVNKPFIYKLWADFSTIESNKKEYLFIKDYKHEGVQETFRGKYKEFQTGETDSSTPAAVKDGVSIPQFLTTVFESMLKPKEEGFSKNTKIDYTREGFPKPLDSEAIPEFMRVKKTWEALAKDPPVKAHAIARAMQLLNVAGIRGNKEGATSSICNIKFPYVEDKSLPAQNQPITNESAIHAVAMLFVDKLSAGQPQITQGAQFEAFKKKLQEVFQDYDKDAAEVQPVASITDIKEEAPAELCTGHTEHRIQVDTNVYSQLRSKAQSLIDRQKTHIRNCMRVLFKLFDERTVKAGGFGISKYVEQNGMDAINAIAEETRNMLIQYYVDSEKIYKDGLFVLLNRHRANPGGTVYLDANRQAIAPAAPAAPAPAPAPAV